MGIPDTKPQTLQTATLWKPLEILIVFIHLINGSSGHGIDRTPPVDPKGISRYALKAEAGEVIGPLHHEGILACTIEILHLHTGVTRVTAPGTLQIGPAGVYVAIGRASGEPEQVCSHRCLQYRALH